MPRAAHFIMASTQVFHILWLRRLSFSGGTLISVSLYFLVYLQDNIARRSVIDAHFGRHHHDIILSDVEARWAQAISAKQKFKKVFCITTTQSVRSAVIIGSRIIVASFVFSFSFSLFRTVRSFAFPAGIRTNSLIFLSLSLCSTVVMNTFVFQFCTMSHVCVTRRVVCQRTTMLVWVLPASSLSLPDNRRRRRSIKISQWRTIRFSLYKPMSLPNIPSTVIWLM